MKIRRRISTVIIVIICFILQTTVFHSVELAGVVPNLLIIVTVCIGYMRGRTEGLFTGLACGLMLDMMYGSVIGLYGFIFMAIGFATGYCQKIYFTDNYVIPIVLVFVGDFLYGIYYFTVEFLLRSRLNFGYCFIHRILPEVIYTVLISLVFYRLLRTIEHRLSDTRKGV